MGTKNKTLKRVKETKIISNREIAEDHFLMELEAPYLAKISAPGQFVNVKVSGNTTDPLLRIPLGIHSANKNKISLLYKVVGKGTLALSERAAGEKLSVLGPLGNGFNLDALSGKEKREAVLVAGGHGVAPLFWLAEFLTNKKIRTIFMIGARTGKHIVRADKIKKIADKVMITTEDGSIGHKGFVTSLLGEYLKKTKSGKPVIFACGPKPMLAAVSKVTEKEGTSAQVSIDEYMACGIGACMGCAVKTKTGYKMVCKDGPVFNSGEIDWLVAVKAREDRCKNEA